jgi:hypothetical protein
MHLTAADLSTAAVVHPWRMFLRRSGLPHPGHQDGLLGSMFRHVNRILERALVKESSGVQESVVHPVTAELDLLLPDG